MNPTVLSTGCAALGFGLVTVITLALASLGTRDALGVPRVRRVWTRLQGAMLSLRQPRIFFWLVIKSSPKSGLGFLWDTVRRLAAFYSNCPF